MALYQKDEIQIVYQRIGNQILFVDATHSLRLNHPDNHKEYKKRLAKAMQEIREATHASA